MKTSAKILAPVFVLLIVGVVAFGLSSHHKAQLTIENRSGEDIDALTVQVSGQLLAVGSVARGATKEVIVTRYSDSHWTLNGAWSASGKIHEEFGYITDGMSFDDRAVFKKDRRLNFTSTPK